MVRKKQTPRNAFYYFMIELKETRGRDIRSMEAAASVAGPLWAKMTAQQKLPYENKAKKAKGDSKKYTSKGIDVEVIQKQENDKLMKHQAMKEDIESIIKLAKETRQLYVPAEIAVVRFNLQDGVLPENVFHNIIRPGQLRTGYASLAMNISKEFHEIPPPTSFEKEESNIDEVMNALLRFIKTTNGRDLPPVYAKDKDMELVSNVLSNYVELPTSQSFRVYSMEYLFYTLRNVVGSLVGNSAVFQTTSISTLELEKDVYDFSPGIACYFHEEKYKPNVCSRSHVIRYVYVICDHCCNDLNIDLIPGRHVPIHSKVPARPKCAGLGDVAAALPPTLEYADDEYLSESETSDATQCYTTASGYTPTDNDGWTQVNRYKRALSECSTSSSHVEVPCRRPNTVSGAHFNPGMSGLSGISRGRGRDFRSSGNFMK